MNKTQMILAPISILVFVIILAIMYGWVDTMAPVGEEAPEVNPVNLLTPNNPANNPEQLVNNPTFPSGIGNGQIQLINQTLPGAPYLGLTLGEVPQLVAKDLNLPPETGVYVKNVTNLSGG